MFTTILFLLVVVAFLCIGAGIVLQAKQGDDNTRALARLNTYAGRAEGRL